MPDHAQARRVPIGMYEGVGSCQGRSVVGAWCAGACRQLSAVDGWLGAVRGGVPIKGLAVASAVNVGRLGCRGMYSRWVLRMMGSLATARLGSIS
jgi:hypothetical protein